jgi:hypothetical protein
MNRSMTMKTFPLSLFCFLGLCLAGCAPTVNSTRFDSVYRPATVGTVEVHTRPENVKREYREIGLISVNDNEMGEWHLSNESKIIGILIQKGREMGADAIILSIPETRDRNYGLGTGHSIVMRGTAIIYK